MSFFEKPDRRRRSAPPARLLDAVLHCCTVSIHPDHVMTTINLTKDNFDKTLDDNPMVVVDFWAAWCGPCRAFSPVFEAASEKNADIVFGKVNTDEEPELAQMFGIRSIPTLMIVREKVVLFQEPGSLPAGPFQDLLDKAKGLDMAEVHRSIEDEKAKAQAQG
jgi:thioredoxin 1